MSDSPVIVVTGANRGIGLEICRQLTGRNAQVVLTARNEKSGRAAAQKISSPKTTVRFAAFDVTHAESTRALADFIRDTFGHCDVLINNAGIVEDGDDSILQI
jgi:NAD(P)-dependent dehydrogenase (short-subunit alcohol dehydrogenase family)